MARQSTADVEGVVQADRPASAPSNGLGLPDLGVGIGLRQRHLREVNDQHPAVGWFEVFSEIYLGSGDRRRYLLDQIAERYPVALHGVALSIGGTDPLDFDYLSRLKRLASALQAPWVSDHLAWTGVKGTTTHALLPLPYDEATLAHVAERTNIVQDVLERPLVIENPTTYVQFTTSTLSEPEFLRGLAAATGCGLLLDVNNVYVCATNFGFDPMAYIRTLPLDRVVEVHLGGHSDHGYLLDNHDAPVASPVWELYRRTVELIGGVSTLIEWDSRLPPLDTLLAEAEKARAVREGVDGG